MTAMETRAPRRPAMPAAALIGALALAGCSSGHIGESWQCPLAEGGSCDSVAAADPAVPDPDASDRTVLKEPLWRMHSAPEALPARGPAPDGIRGPGQAVQTACEAGCGGGFDPFGWLARLFTDGGAGDGGPGAGPQPATGAAESEALPAGTAREADAAPSSAPEQADPRSAEPAAAALPDDPGRPADDERDALRTREVVARIWIAPFVDANGVYREASHVRVVLEPAGWRLPR